MQQIDFHFNVTNRSMYVCRLIKKVTGMHLSVGVWSTDEVLLQLVYNDLWRFEDLTVISHAWAGSDYESETSVLFAKDIGSLGKKDVLILLDDYVPEHWQEAFQNFDRVVDIVSTNPEELELSRNRYRTYRDAKITLKAYDRSKS